MCGLKYGTSVIVSSGPSLLAGADWGVSGEDAGDKRLWEDNWDDDNVEDEFSCQLR